ncbi:TPA: hypothetical protein N0F65_000956 [Lagenidium giganteum]|uniref:Uncharacterized protein n=1 Tax=Lagenidium giganteum TaxID=4803 RepID=A0AAV2YXQ9_9STRA|nr:TPA: hypothetical protein N0F65_000956 [Lagenidium giganteum]
MEHGQTGDAHIEHLKAILDVYGLDIGMMKFMVSNNCSTNLSAVAVEAEHRRYRLCKPSVQPRSLPANGERPDTADAASSPQERRGAGPAHPPTCHSLKYYEVVIDVPDARSLPPQPGRYFVCARGGRGFSTWCCP